MPSAYPTSERHDDDSPGGTGAEEFDLEAFHAGNRTVLARCYRAHFGRVFAVVSKILNGADVESVVHELFCRLVASPEMRASFRGGNLGAWLTQVGRNLAIDHARRWRRESAPLGESVAADGPAFNDEVEAKLLVERFRVEILPKELEAVFEARFLRQLPQRAAAEELRMPRTTLVYQEKKVRSLLQRFLLGKELA